MSRGTFKIDAKLTNKPETFNFSRPNVDNCALVTHALCAHSRLSIIETSGWKERGGNGAVT